jgi:acetoin utilization protein AcuB
MRLSRIDQFMTRCPHTIGLDQPIADAQRAMRAHGIRHLPVLDGGRLVGLVSERDLLFVDRLLDLDREQLPVSEAMSPEVYTVASDAPLLTVVVEMADHKYGSAVIMEAGSVAGVFTTIDALRAFAALLTSGTET